MADNDKLTDHDYDGIQEYDNPLPMWWLITFFGTIIFAYLYFLHYQTGAGKTQVQELTEDMAIVKEAQKQQKGDSEEDLKKAAAGGGAEKGLAVYNMRCAVCHGQELQGNIGPNLTDDYWINGKGDAASIAKVVREGVSDKGMPPWGPILSNEEVQMVSVFVVSKHGSNPRNPKAPQGNKIGQ